MSGFGRIRSAAGNMADRLREKSTHKSKNQASSSRTLDLNEDIQYENVHNPVSQEEVDVTAPNTGSTYDPHTSYYPHVSSDIDLNDIEVIQRYAGVTVEEMANEFRMDPLMFAPNSPRNTSYGHIGTSVEHSRDFRGHHDHRDDMNLASFGDYQSPPHVQIPPRVSSFMQMSPQIPESPQGGYGGGPPDTDLLVHYGTHVADHIWNNPDFVRVLKCHTRKAVIDVLKRYACIGEGQPWLTLVEQSRLLCLRDWTFRETDEALVSAFVERWHPETNSFHFSWGEMTITLHDVQQILQLPIDGMKMTHAFSGRDDMQIREVIAEMFGFELKDLNKQIASDGGVNIVKLKKFIKNGILHGGNQEVIASAYLLLLLGNTLFPDKSVNAVPYKLMHLLLNHGATSQFAWGAGALALLYRQLGMASRRNASQLSGSMYILHVWIWAHFPRWRGRLSRKVGQQPIDYQGDRGRHRDTEQLMDIRLALDRMPMNELDWMPWRECTRFTDGDASLTRYRGLLTYFSIQEPYMPERCFRQLGFCQTIPRLPVIMPATVVRNDNLRRYQYMVTFRREDDLWDNQWIARVAEGVRSVFPYSADDWLWIRYTSNMGKKLTQTLV